MATLATSVSAITAERRFYLMLAAIIAVTVFAGDPRAFKVTTPLDLALARALEP